MANLTTERLDELEAIALEDVPAIIGVRRVELVELVRAYRGQTRGEHVQRRDKSKPVCGSDLPLQPSERIAYDAALQDRERLTIELAQAVRERDRLRNAR